MPAAQRKHISTPGSVNAAAAKALGARLRELRDRARMSLQEASEASGVDLNQVHRAEHGRGFPRPYTIARLARAYGVQSTGLVQAAFRAADEALA